MGRHINSLRNPSLPTHKLTRKPPPDLGGSQRTAATQQTVVTSGFSLCPLRPQKRTCAVQRVKRPTTTSHQVGAGLAPPVRADERKHTVDKGECTVKKNQGHQGQSKPEECRTPNAIAAMPDILVVSCNVSYTRKRHRVQPTYSL
jgi:hypothetical protein